MIDRHCLGFDEGFTSPKSAGLAETKNSKCCDDQLGRAHNDILDERNLQ